MVQLGAVRQYIHAEALEVNLCVTYRKKFIIFGKNSLYSF